MTTRAIFAGYPGVAVGTAQVASAFRTRAPIRSSHQARRRLAVRGKIEVNIS